MRATEKPMLFSTPLVQAILAGRKTQTRRPVKWPKWADAERDWPALAESRALARYIDGRPVGVMQAPAFPGDLLYVRETWADTTEILPDGRPNVVYRAHGESCSADNCGVDRKSGSLCSVSFWRPSIHMPKWAARIWLRVTDVRVDRVQDITPDDAIAEGVFHGGRYSTEPGIPYPVATFADAWRSIYGESWDRNDWVWRIAFERCEAPARVGRCPECHCTGWHQVGCSRGGR